MRTSDLGACHMLILILVPRHFRVTNVGRHGQLDLLTDSLKLLVCQLEAAP